MAAILPRGHPRSAQRVAQTPAAARNPLKINGCHSIKSAFPPQTLPRAARMHARPRAARTAAAVGACAGSRVFTIGHTQRSHTQRSHTQRSHMHAARTLHARCTHAARPHAHTRTHTHTRTHAHARARERTRTHGRAFFFSRRPF